MRWPVHIRYARLLHPHPSTATLIPFSHPRHGPYGRASPHAVTRREGNGERSESEVGSETQENDPRNGPDYFRLTAFSPHHPHLSRLSPAEPVRAGGEDG